jgi:hypothetical protein
MRRVQQRVGVVVEHVVVGQRDGIESRRFQAGDVPGVRAEVEGLARPGNAAIGQHAFEIPDPHVGAGEHRQHIAPRMRGTGAREPVVDQPAKHDVADEADFHAAPYPFPPGSGHIGSQSPRPGKVPTMSDRLEGKPVSLWVATAGPTTYPTLDTDVEVDVAVAGGGIAGLTAALALKRAGLTVAVMESARIGSGVTGSTTGKVTSLHRLVYTDLA